MENVDLSNWLTILGWFIVFFLGIVSTIIYKRINAKRKILSYAIISEIGIFSVEDFTGYEIPIGITINGISEDSLSTVRVKFGNRGNIELQNISISIRFGEDSKLHFEKLVCDSQSYLETVEVIRNSNYLQLNLNHLNKGKSFEIDLILSNYINGEISIELAEPGVELKSIDPFRWDLPVGFLNTLSVGILGVRIDANAQQTSNLVKEISSIRQIIESEHYLKMRESRREKFKNK